MRRVEAVFKGVHFGAIRVRLLIIVIHSVRVSFSGFVYLLRTRSRRVRETLGFRGGLFLVWISLVGLGFLREVLLPMVFWALVLSKVELVTNLVYSNGQV